MLRPINPYAGKETANPVIVETWSKKSILEYRVIDFNNPDSRKWLVEFALHEMQHNRAFILYQYKDDFQFRLFNGL